MNTAVEYQYRDGSNYKQAARVVFAGEVTDLERTAITAALEDGEYMLAEQVGLDSLRTAWGSHYDDDHVWHELLDIELVTQAPTTSRSIHEFAAEFHQIVWDTTQAVAALESWKARTPAGR